MRAVWAIYALLPLILIPAALGYLHRNLRLQMNIWFLTVGVALISIKGKLRCFGYFAIIIAVLGFIGGFRNVTSIVSIVAEINNFLLPTFLIILGIFLLRVKKALLKILNKKSVEICEYSWEMVKTVISLKSSYY